jgi:3-dehydroquinate dehydratase/shikimate dehydrogenase
MKDAKQAMPIKESELNAGLVFDMVYNPLETPLLKLARSRGIPVITGLEMFVQQGARQFEIWTGQPAPEAEMLRAVQLELSRRA